MDAAEYIEQLEAIVVARWQPIEVAPKDGTDVLVCNIFGNLTGYGTRPAWFSSSNRSWIGAYDGGKLYDPSHWMPLPKPPVE